MWELPSVAHFAKVFSQPLRLRKFTPDVSVHSLPPGRLCTMGLARCAHAGAGAERKPPCTAPQDLEKALLEPRGSLLLEELHYRLLPMKSGTFGE